MDADSRLDFLRGLQRTGIVPGLSRIRPLLERLGNPEKQFASVLITGTNGKGSTAAFVEAMLRAAGYRTGLFTSPHLLTVRERVRIQGRSLTPRKFEAYGEAVKAAIDPSDPVTYFEALTAIGFFAFAREGVEIAVVEVGMGGKYDSTNVLDPLVSVFTNVSLDHQRYLGNTLEEIAAEKVAIARPGRVMITGVAEPVFGKVVRPALATMGAHALRLQEDFWAFSRDGLINYIGQKVALQNLRIALHGTFQKDNAAIALATVEALSDAGFPVSEQEMRLGLSRTWWPGRFQIVSKNPTTILDGAHNPGGAARLRETVEYYRLRRPMVLVHATKPDKDFCGVLSHLLPLCDACVETWTEGLCEPEIVAQTARELDACAVFVERDLGRAMLFARKLAGAEGTVLVTGSLYLVGAVLANGIQ